MTKRGNQLLDVDNFKREHELLIMKFRNQKPKKLTITKVINKIGLLKGLKDIYFDASLNELVNKINNLPYKDELFAEEDYIKKCLDGNAEYSYSRIPMEGGCIPPWETQAYIDAENWMKSLPEEDQDKIKLLIRVAKTIWG